jgi:F-type H+-transporting ATPase subunit b
LLQLDFGGRISVPFFGFLEGSIQLVPDGTLLFHLALIVGMVALLNATLLKPINRILQEREQRTQGRLSEAGKALASVEAKVRDYEIRLRQARNEGYALMEQERAALAAERERKIAEVRSEVSRWLAEEQEKLKGATSQVRQTLQSDAQAIAQQISRQILQREVSQ